MSHEDETRKQRKKEANEKTRKKYREYMQAYKLEHGCAICGYNEHACALHFDHIDPSEKEFDISRGRDVSWKRFLAEIAKCRVLCANCHAVETMKNKDHLVDRS